MSFATQPDINAWADQVPLNPARIPPGTTVTADLTAALERYRKSVEPGLARMAQLDGDPETGQS